MAQSLEVKPFVKLSPAHLACRSRLWAAPLEREHPDLRSVSAPVWEHYGSFPGGCVRPRALRARREASLLLRGSVCRRRRAEVTEAGTTSIGTAEILRRRRQRGLTSDDRRCQDHTVEEVSYDHRDRRAPTVVEGHEARRFELLGRRRTVLLARHPRVHRGQRRHGHAQHVERVHEADGASQQPGRPAPALEGRGVNGGENPAVQEVDTEAYQFRPVAVWREHGPQHKGEVYAAETEPLATCHQGSQDYRAYKPPKRDAALIHV